jgi:hypothetical protein
MYILGIKSRDSSFGIKMGYGLGGQDSIPGRGKFFLFFIDSRPALVLTQPRIQWVPGAISQEGESGWYVKLTAHLHLVPRSKMEIYLHAPICLYGIVLN